MDVFELTASGGGTALDEPAASSPAIPRKRLSGSPQQVAFWEELVRGTDNVLLEARAGTGKSSSAREGMWRLLEAHGDLALAYCCFNKKIADEFRANCPPGVDVGTMHRFGYAALQQSLGSTIDEHKTYTVLDSMEGGATLKRYIRKAIATLVGHAKGHGLHPDDPGLEDRLREFVVFHDVETWRQLGLCVSWAKDVLARSAEMTSIVDFDDMLWLPVLYPVRFPGVDILFIDECLPAWTPIHLADGSSKTIGEIVENRLPVEVLSFDTETGRQRPCKVVNWSKTLNRKPLVKIKVRWKRKHEVHKNYPTNFVICTTDHKVWADGRWIPAGEVKPGMLMQVETCAAKSQAGKITAKGRKVLAASIGPRNDAGIMGGKNRPGHRPVIRGGNGQGPSLAEETLHQALGPGWEQQYVVATGLRSSGYPHCYKIDLANPETMTAVEVDGQSHRGVRREADNRKDEFLRSQGWKVIRVTNREAIQDTEACAARILTSDCPIGAEIVSVDPVEIPDSYVYDLTVEGCHNFYANGILVHNCQDLSPVQHMLAERMSGSGRTVIIGDEFQSIYGWRGADSDSIPKLRERLSCKALPLTVTWRCPRSHVELARGLVPDFEAAPDAPEGTLVEGPMGWVDRAGPGDLVLCRANAPIISACLRAIGNRVPAVVRGRAIGRQLHAVIRKVGDADTIGDFVRGVAAWRAREVGRLEAKDGTEQLVEEVTDRAACLEAVASACQSPPEVPALIDSLFADDDAANRITFSSVHRAKGSEARRVTYIQVPYSERRDKLRPPMEWEVQQRRNLRYVAVTRSLDTLTLVA